MPQMPMQIQNRIFTEIHSRSDGMFGKVLGTGLSPDGQDVIFYSVHNMMGQCILNKDTARVEDFNRYLKMGKLLWKG